MAGRKRKRRSRMSVVDWIAILLLVVGGINWGLVGALQFDIVEWLAGSIPWLLKTVYILVGLAGLYGLAFLAKNI